MAAKFLVHDADGKGHLPYTDDSGKIDHGRMGAAWAALHGGYRGNKYEGPDKSEAIKKLTALYKSEGMELPSDKGKSMDAPNKHVSVLLKSVEEKPDGMYVRGTLAAEEPDYSGEIMDYEKSKPLFKAWNDEYSAATSGRSIGNLRVQHSKTHVAGKFVDMNYDDANKRVEVVAKVIDPVAKEMVREGVLTSFSIGVHTEKEWRDGQYQRWYGRPVEGSLVDFGCMPSTRNMREIESGFKYRSLDGTEEHRDYDGMAYLRHAFKSRGITLTTEQENRIAEAAGGLTGLVEIGKAIQVSEAESTQEEEMSDKALTEKVAELEGKLKTVGDENESLKVENEKLKAKPKCSQGKSAADCTDPDCPKHGDDSEDGDNGKAVSGDKLKRADVEEIVGEKVKAAFDARLKPIEELLVAQHETLQAIFEAPADSKIKSKSVSIRKDEDASGKAKADEPDLSKLSPDEKTKALITKALSAGGVYRSNAISDVMAGQEK